jgi:Fe-S-cluster containining protein
MLCGIYQRRPAICRDYEVGGSDCIAQRSDLAAVSNQRMAPL